MAKTKIPIPRRAKEAGLTYRDMGERDLKLSAEIYASTRREEIAQTGWPPDQQAQFLQSQFYAQHKHYQEHYPDAAWLIIGLGFAPVGRLYLEEWTKETRIIDIAFLPQFRGKGWGEAVLRDLMEDAAARGVGVSIHVEKNNPAMRLYKRLGFEFVEDKGVYDLMAWSVSPN